MNAAGRAGKEARLAQGTGAAADEASSKETPCRTEPSGPSLLPVTMATQTKRCVGSTDRGPDGPQKNASKAQRLGRNYHYFKNVKTLSQGFNRKTTRTFLAGGRTDGSRPADGGGGANTAAVQGNRSAARTGRPRSRQLSATCAGELRAVPHPRQAWLETCFPLGKIKMTQRNGESHRARWGRPRRSGGTCAARPRARGDTVT